VSKGGQCKKESPWEKGPPWKQGDFQRWRRPRHQNPARWQQPGSGLFLRFLFIFGLVAALILGGMGILALLFTRAVGGADQVAPLVWVASCGLALALPLAAVTIAGRAYRYIALPLADVMAAADAVAEGDLTVRVDESGTSGGTGNRWQFGRLARSFNRMTEELQRSDQMRRSLTADVAHELRTPLHIIQGNLEGILDGVYEPDDEHIEATLDETRMLARLVDDLHTLSQAEAGQLSLNWETVDVAELLADVETSFSGLMAAKGIDLTVECAGDSAGLMVAGDVDRLDQVLTNLVVNALRHTPPGGRVTLLADRSGEDVRIVVADTGIGIPEEELPYIFERFWRGEESRTHVDGAGAGLGLAIAKQLVETHQGTIIVSSTPGSGTRFIISLPAV
jgi:two-component system sensor histidine kinase BaeS